MRERSENHEMVPTTVQSRSESSSSYPIHFNGNSSAHYQQSVMASPPPPSSAAVGSSEAGASLTTTPGIAVAAAALRTQSLPSIPMGPPPPPPPAPPSSSLTDGVLNPVSLFSMPGPPGPPIFTSPLRPAPSYPGASTPAKSSGAIGNFSENTLVPPPGMAFANSGAVAAAASQAGGVAEDVSDPYGLSASSPFVLFSAQKVLKEKKIMNTASLGFGALVCPGRETAPSPFQIREEPVCCVNCGACVNPYCSVLNSGEWKCVFCNKLNGSNGEFRAGYGEDMHNWPQLVTSVVDYVDAGTRPPGLISIADASWTAPLVLVIDDSLDEVHLLDLQSSLHSFLDSLSPTTRIGIVTYGRTVSVYDLSESGVAAADVLPGDTALSEEHLKVLIYGTGVYLAPIHACLSIAHGIVSALRPYQGDLAEVGRERCLGAAVEAVLALIQGPSAELPGSTVKRPGGRSRVLVCAGGPTTLGPGSLPLSESHPNYAYLEKKAIKHMEHLGHEAQLLDIAVDILCAGTCPVRIPTLQPLAKASGGVLVLHDNFGEAFGLNLQRAVRRLSGFRGVVEFRCSGDIAVTHVIGPGEQPHGDGVLERQFRNDISTTVQVPSVEDSQSFAIMMELQENLTDDLDHVYFQFTAHYSTLYQAQVTRVVTVRLPTTTSVSTYLQSVDDEVAAVLIAKKTVLNAKSVRDLADMRASVDERLKDIAQKFGNTLPKSKLRSFPASLAKLPELLFHLRRGPLLGSIIGHEDERAVYRSLYLQAGFDLSLRMMAPRLLMHRGAGTFEELPAHDLALQSNAVIVLDHGTDFFIWTGLDIAADEAQSAGSEAACLTLAHELTEQRFPAPRLLAFKEGSSQARYLKARLIPAHKDPPYEQDARFPQLRSLSVEQRARLKNSFVQTDESSFCEWMRSLKLVPP